MLTDEKLSDVDALFATLGRARRSEHDEDDVIVEVDAECLREQAQRARRQVDELATEVRGLRAAHEGDDDATAKSFAAFMDMKARAEKAEAGAKHWKYHADKWAEVRDQVIAERDAASRRAESAERERDAYKRAKTENDDRFMCERDESRAELARTTAERDALARLGGIVICAGTLAPGEDLVDAPDHAMVSAILNMKRERDHWRQVAESRPDITRELARAFVAVTWNAREWAIADQLGAEACGTALRAHASTPGTEAAVEPCGYCGEERGPCSPPGCDVAEDVWPAKVTVPADVAETFRMGLRLAIRHTGSLERTKRMEAALTWLGSLGDGGAS